MDTRFEALLLEYARAHGEGERKRVEDLLWSEFGREKAVLVMDMSGFSLLTQRHGIVHYLSMVGRMQIATRPIVERLGGQIVKFEADNCFAMFDAVLPAVRAAIELSRTFDDLNRSTDDDFDLRVSIGIDYGMVLLIGGPDYFGDAVNRACKLGEDVAGPGEVLVTETAFHRCPADAGIHGEVMHLSISGIRLDAVKLKYVSTSNRHLSSPA